MCPRHYTVYPSNVTDFSWVLQMDQNWLVFTSLDLASRNLILSLLSDQEYGRGIDCECYRKQSRMSFVPHKKLDPDLDEINEEFFIDCGGIRVKVPAISQQLLAAAWEAEILLRYETSKMCERQR